MIINIKKNNRIEQYIIIIDKDKLEPLDQEIDENCSETIHHEEEFEGNYFESAYKYYTVSNVKREKIGTEHYDDKATDIYRYTFDEYVPSCLLDIYDRLMEDDLTALDELYYRKNRVKECKKEIKKAKKDLKIFDEHIFPYLQELSDRLMRGDITALKDLDCYDNKNKKIKKRFKKVILDAKFYDKGFGANISEPSFWNWYIKSRRLKYLSSIKNLKSEYKNVKKESEKEDPYIEKMLGCVSYKLVDSVSLNESKKSSKKKIKRR